MFRIELTTVHENDVAHAAYRKAGNVETGLRFKKAFEPWMVGKAIGSVCLVAPARTPSSYFDFGSRRTQADTRRNVQAGPAAFASFASAVTSGAFSASASATYAAS